MFGILACACLDTRAELKLRLTSARGQAKTTAKIGAVRRLFTRPNFYSAVVHYSSIQPKNIAEFLGIGIDVVYKRRRKFKTDG